MVENISTTFNTTTLHTTLCTQQHCTQQHCTQQHGTHKKKATLKATNKTSRCTSSSFQRIHKHGRVGVHFSNNRVHFSFPHSFPPKMCPGQHHQHFTNFFSHHHIFFTRLRRHIQFRMAHVPLVRFNVGVVAVGQGPQGTLHEVHPTLRFQVQQTFVVLEFIANVAQHSTNASSSNDAGGPQFNQQRPQQPTLPIQHKVPPGLDARHVGQNAANEFPRVVPSFVVNHLRM